MKCEIECLKCRSGTIQDYKLVSPMQAIVTTTCINKKCKHQVSHLVSIDSIRNEASSIAMRLEHYGCVLVT